MTELPRDPRLALDGLVATFDLLAVAMTPAGLADGPVPVCVLARRYFGAVACSVAALDEDTDELVYVAASGAGAAEVLGVRLPVTRGIAGWVAQSGQPLSVSDLSRDTRFARDVAESTNYIPTALLAVPVETAGRVIGVLSVLDRDADRPGAGADLSAAAEFASMAAAMVQAREAFGGAGRLLATALSASVDHDTTLAAAIGNLPRTSDPALRGFAELLARLHSAGAAERVLCLRVLSELMSYIEAVSGQMPGGMPSASR